MTCNRGFVTLLGAYDLAVLSVGIEYGKDKLRRLPLSARYHLAGGLALCQTHFEGSGANSASAAYLPVRCSPY